MACGSKVLTQLVLWVFYNEKRLATFYLSCDHFRDMTQPIFGIKLDFHWQMTHVELANNVAHLHNIEHLKSSSIITPHWKVENLLFQILDQQLP